MALLVIGACLALVFDRLWLDAAQVELQAAAESAALAGAGQLATDARLNPQYVDFVNPARDAAIAVGQKNYSVGTQVNLRNGDDGDVQIGKVEMSSENGHVQFVTETDQPTTCEVRAARLKSRGNPIALFFRQLTSNTKGDAQAFAVASVDNRIIGVQPGNHAPVPALPLAILYAHPDPRRPDTWQRLIEMRLGFDRHGFDATTGTVTNEPDGIPEITLHNAPPGADKDDAAKVNLLGIDVGNGLQENLLAHEVTTGWTVNHLRSFGGQFRVDQGPQQLDTEAALVGQIQTELQQLVGQTRICGLYIDHQPTSSTIGRAAIVNLVGIRILTVTVEESGHKLQITAQPAVITTSTALLAHQDAVWTSGATNEPANPYIYKLFLSH